MKRRTCVPIILLLLATPVFAAETILNNAVDRDARELAAYERAVGISPVDPTAGDQVRIWYIDVLGQRITAYVVTADGARKCTLRYTTHGNQTSVKRGKCSSLRIHRDEAARVLALLTEVASLDGKQAFCPIMDGWNGELSGAVGGRGFHVSIGNNDQCDDADSRLINRLSELIEKSFDPGYTK